MTPTSRTLERLRAEGYMAGVVERWIPQARRRVDLFGFIDILAVGPFPPASDQVETLAVQCTSGSNVASRVSKITNDCPEAALRWLSCRGNSIEVWGWRKLRRPGRKQWFRVRHRIASCGDRLVASKLPENQE